MSDHTSQQPPQHHAHGTPPGPGWKRMHHGIGFWIALFLMLAAIFIYVMTGDLSSNHVSPPKPAPTQPDTAPINTGR